MDGGEEWWGCFGSPLQLHQPGKDIIFNNSQQYKKGKPSKGHSAFPPLTAAEQAQLYNDLSQCRTQEEQIIKPVVLSVVKEYAASYVPNAVMLDLPEPLTNLYDKQTRDLNLAEALFEDITVTKEQVQNILSIIAGMCVCLCQREREAQARSNQTVETKTYLWFTSYRTSFKLQSV